MRRLMAPLNKDEDVFSLYTQLTTMPLPSALEPKNPPSMTQRAVVSG